MLGGARLTRRRALLAAAALAASRPLRAQTVAARPVAEPDADTKADPAGPLVFDHVFGQTVLARPGRRVITLGGTLHDALFAMGLPPLALRLWWGDYPSGIWPWAQPYAGDSHPVVIGNEVPMEVVAGLNPDLILAAGSGISREEYVLLSQIAPVIMQEARYSTYGSPWQQLTRMIGRAVGMSDKAAALVAGVEADFAAARARHPDWRGKTAVAAWHDGGDTGAYTLQDARARFLDMLGFVIPQAVRDRDSMDAFYTTLSPEDLSPLDADLLVWVSARERAVDIARLPMRQSLVALREGREVFADQLIGGAMSIGSVLSLPFALRHLEPEFALALDGDPATVVPSARAVGLAP